MSTRYEEPPSARAAIEEAMLFNDPNIEISPTGLQVIQAAEELTVPVMDALWWKYGNMPRPDGGTRGWKACGPAAILDGHYLSMATGVPFGQYWSPRRLQILLGVHESGIEHAELAYIDEEIDEVVRIDRVAGLLWPEGENQNPYTATRFFHGRLSFADTEQRLTENLYAFGHRNVLWGVDIWQEDIPTNPRALHDHLAIMHSPEVFQDTVHGPSGAEYDISSYWGATLRDVFERVYHTLPSHWEHRNLQNILDEGEPLEDAPKYAGIDRGSERGLYI